MARKWPQVSTDVGLIVVVEAAVANAALGNMSGTNTRLNVELNVIKRTGCLIFGKYWILKVSKYLKMDKLHIIVCWVQ